MAPAKKYTGSCKPNINQKSKNRENATPAEVIYVEHQNTVCVKPFLEEISVNPSSVSSLRQFRNSSVFSRRIPVTSTGDIKQEVPSEISTKNVGGRDIKQEKDEEEEGELSIPEIGKCNPEKETWWSDYMTVDVKPAISLDLTGNEELSSDGEVSFPGNRRLLAEKGKAASRKKTTSRHRHSAVDETSQVVSECLKSPHKEMSSLRNFRRGYLTCSSFDKSLTPLDDSSKINAPVPVKDKVIDNEESLPNAEKNDGLIIEKVLNVKYENAEVYVHPGIVTEEDDGRNILRSILRNIRIQGEGSELAEKSSGISVDQNKGGSSKDKSVFGISVKDEPDDEFCYDSEGDDSMWLGEEDGHWDGSREPSVSIKTEDEDLTHQENSFDEELDSPEKRKAGKKKMLSRKQKLKSFRLETMKPLKIKSKPAISAQDGEFSYTCPFCPFITSFIVQMKRHRVRHVADGALNCKRCEFATKSKKDFKDHLIKHYQNESSSEDSDDAMIEEDEFQDTKIDLLSSKEFFPFQKPLIVNTESSPPQRIASGSVPSNETKMYEKILDLRCKYCPFFTSYRSVMNQHKTIHQAEGVMYCPQCDLSTRDRDEYKTHLMKHYQRDSFICHYCGYTTSSQYLHQRHIVKHTEKSFSCSHCSYTTGFKKAFKYHVLKHSAEKLLRCKHCPFITKYRHNFRQHMATHTGKGLMFCDFCSFYSAWETNFSRHLARHKMEEEARKLEEQACKEAEETMVFGD